MLMKRDHPGGGVEIIREESNAMSVVDIEKAASSLWELAVTAIEKRERCSRSKAYDLAMRDPVAREAYDLSKNTYLDRMQKLGDGDVPQPHYTPSGGGGRVPSKTHDTGHGASSNSATIDPHDDVRHEVEVDDGELWKTYSDAVEEAAQHMSQSDALDYVRKTFPKMWQRVKALKGDRALNEPGSLDQSAGRSKTMLPLSHDGNAGRPVTGM